MVGEALHLNHTAAACKFQHLLRFQCQCQDAQVVGANRFAKFVHMPGGKKYPGHMGLLYLNL